MDAEDAHHDSRGHREQHESESMSDQHMIPPLDIFECDIPSPKICKASSMLRPTANLLK